MGDLLSQTEACLGGPPGPPSLVQLACLQGPGAALGGHVCPRLPALLVDLQGRHLQWRQHRSERDEQGTQTLVQWAYARNSGTLEPLSGGQVTTVHTAVLET